MCGCAPEADIRLWHIDGMASWRRRAEVLWAVHAQLVAYLMQLAGVGVVIAVMPIYWKVYSRQVMIHIAVGILLEIVAGAQVRHCLHPHLHLSHYKLPYHVSWVDGVQIKCSGSLSWKCTAVRETVRNVPKASGGLLVGPSSTNSFKVCRSLFAVKCADP